MFLLDPIGSIPLDICLLISPFVCLPPRSYETMNPSQWSTQGFLRPLLPTIPTNSTLPTHLPPRHKATSTPRHPHHIWHPTTTITPTSASTIAYHTTPTRVTHMGQAMGTRANLDILADQTMDPVPPRTIETTLMPARSIVEPLFTTTTGTTLVLRSRTRPHLQMHLLLLSQTRFTFQELAWVS